MGRSKHPLVLPTYRGAIVGAAALLAATLGACSGDPEEAAPPDTAAPTTSEVVASDVSVVTVVPPTTLPEAEIPAPERDATVGRLVAAGRSEGEATCIVGSFAGALTERQRAFAVAMLTAPTDDPAAVDAIVTSSDLAPEELEGLPDLVFDLVRNCGFTTETTVTEPPG